MGWLEWWEQCYCGPNYGWNTTKSKFSRMSSSVVAELDREDDNNDVDDNATDKW